MTNEEILEQQVEALEKLLQLKQAVINELEEKVARLQSPGYVISNTPYIPSVFSPNTWQCSDGTPHSYPPYWNSTVPPCCSKCGQMASSSGVVTVQGGSTMTGVLPVHTTGYVAPYNASNQLTLTPSSHTMAVSQDDDSNNLITLTSAAK